VPQSAAPAWTGPPLGGGHCTQWLLPVFECRQIGSHGAVPRLLSCRPPPYPRRFSWNRFPRSTPSPQGGQFGHLPPFQQSALPAVARIAADCPLRGIPLALTSTSNRNFSVSYRCLSWHITCTRLRDREQRSGETMMSDSPFTAEQLAQEARADMQQNEVLRDWLLAAFDQHRDHINMGRAFTNGRVSYRPRRHCSARLEHSLDEGSTQRRACASARCPITGRAA